MAEEPARPPVTHLQVLEAAAAVDTILATVVTLTGLPAALKQDTSEIIVAPPPWLPKALFVLFAGAVFLTIAIQGLASWKALMLGYNVEWCQKVPVKGIELSNCLKLTKP